MRHVGKSTGLDIIRPGRLLSVWNDWETIIFRYTFRLEIYEMLDSSSTDLQKYLRTGRCPIDIPKSRRENVI